MSQSDDEDIGGAASLGINKILLDSGVDPESFSSLFSKTGGGRSSKAFAEVEAEDDDAKFMDDVSDSEMPADTEEEMRAKAARERDEARWYNRAMQMQREAEVKVKEQKRKDKEKILDVMEEVKVLWPDFAPGKRLKMSEVFYDSPAFRRALNGALGKRKRDDKVHIQHHFKTAHSDDMSPLASFLQPSLGPLPDRDPNQPMYDAPIGANFDPEWTRKAKLLRRQQMRQPPADIRLGGALDSQSTHTREEAEAEELEKTLDLADWEKDIVLCAMDQPEQKVNDPLAPRNDILDSGTWLQDVIWDARRVSPSLLEDEDETVQLVTDKVPEASAKLSSSKAIAKLDPYNFSNDHIYEQSKESRHRIRQTFGAIEVFHSGPAKALQLPFYKTGLSKQEARSWRRPALQFPINVPITFSKLKSNPSASISSKKKAMMADPSERFKTSKDLTLSEKGPYVLLEFSEEYPPIMSGYGMGTTMVNYYRKKGEQDEHIPKLDFGQPSVLNVGDAEPFLLGYVEKGGVTQVIHNNLLRAPIFRHQPETTDFLVIRQTINGHTSYHLRAINNIFTVGQTVPNESEVPGPHARKSTDTSKQRLMIVAWLLMQKNSMRRLKLNRMLRYFPDQTELQLRQRLKIKGNEFLMYAKQPGPGQGHWTLNPEYSFPTTRKEVLETCTPEAAMLFEAMQAGQRHLYDAGYTKTAEGKKKEDEGMEGGGLDLEQQLAVWDTTENYKKAELQKAWLLVHGAGEPTGRGEGFSFLTTNMKGYFLRRGETYEGRRRDAERESGNANPKISHAAQQNIYEEEKKKVWDEQWRALSNPVAPELTPQDEVEEPVAQTPVAFGSRFSRGESFRARSRGGSLAMTPALESPGRDMSPAFSADGESTFTGNHAGAGKVMRIKRVIKGKESVVIVRDPAVIKAYMRKVEEQKLEYYMNHPEAIKRTGNAEEDALQQVALQARIDAYEKNKLRREARKRAMRGELETFEGDEAGRRRCGACGAVGHTKANRMCPMYDSNVKQSPAITTPSGATPGGYGGMVFPTQEVMPPEPSATTFKIKLGNKGA